MIYEAVSKRPSLRVVPGSVSRPLRRAAGALKLPCRHRRIEVDPVERRVVCLDCRAEVDPYEALDMLAKEIERYDWSVDAARAEAERRQRDLENLRRLEANARARVRRVVRELPECSCDPVARYGRFCRECGGRVKPTERKGSR